MDVTIGRTHMTDQKPGGLTLLARIRARLFGARHTGTTSNIRRLIRTALRRETERAQYLDRACKGQPHLKMEFTELLQEIDNLVRRALKSPRDAQFSFIEQNCQNDLVREGARIALDRLKQKLQPHSQTDLRQRYRPGAVLGHGGMGIVREAEQIEPVRRQVAIKLLNPQLLDEERFNTEVMALSKLGRSPHENIVTFYEAGRLARIAHRVFARRASRTI